MAKEIIENLGKIISLDKCPSCQNKVSYNLIRKYYPTPKLLRFLCKENYSWFCECEQCQNSVKIPPHEAERVSEVKEIFNKVQLGEIEAAQFLQSISQFTFVADLLNQHYSWFCPGCNTKVDWSLQVCWNCSTPNPEFKAQNGAIEATPQAVKPPCCG